MTRTLVAAFGNALRGDDAFGLRVLERLEALAADRRLGDGVTLLEVGTGGLQLAQELLDGYARVVVVDAMRRGEEVGTVRVLRVEEIEAVERVDLHLAVPQQALSAAKAMGALPGEVYIVGCEAGEVDELTMDLTPPVAAAVPRAVEEIVRLLAAPVAGGVSP